MRLLDSTTLELKEFYDDQIPKYAILSHTWELEEVTFGDVKDDRRFEMAGYRKIKLAADQAARDGHGYIWVDTCCINKESSAELSEAINSMFNWYAKSEVCYVFLEGVFNKDGILNCRWFTRGWTLQELLAPSQVRFFSCEWKFLGEKTLPQLKSVLLKATGICKDHSSVLTSFRADDWTIAAKMSWASRRKTTRAEDIAYCLLGLFGVNMPLLYGEGTRAFTRLQEEIMRVSDDRSLFAWTDDGIMSGCFCGLLARSPAQFGHTRFPNGVFWKPAPTIIAPLFSGMGTPYFLTNKGIQIQFKLYCVNRLDPDLYYALLSYGDANNQPKILVRRLLRNEFVRVRPDLIFTESNFKELNVQYDWVGPGDYWGLEEITVNIKQRTPTLKLENRNPSKTLYWISDIEFAKGRSRLKASNICKNAKWSASTSTLCYSRPELLSSTSQRITVGSFTYAIKIFRFLTCKLDIRDDGSCIFLNTGSPFYRRPSTPTYAKLIVYFPDVRLILTAHTTLESSGQEGRGDVFSIVLGINMLEKTNYFRSVYSWRLYLGGLISYIVLRSRSHWIGYLVRDFLRTKKILKKHRPFIKGLLLSVPYLSLV